MPNPDMEQNSALYNTFLDFYTLAQAEMPSINEKYRKTSEDLLVATTRIMQGVLTPDEQLQFNTTVGAAVFSISETSTASDTQEISQETDAV